MIQVVLIKAAKKTTRLSNTTIAFMATHDTLPIFGHDCYPFVRNLLFFENCITLVFDLLFSYHTISHVEREPVVISSFVVWPDVCVHGYSIGFYLPKFACVTDDLDTRPRVKRQPSSVRTPHGTALKQSGRRGVQLGERRRADTGLYTRDIEGKLD